MVRRDVVRGALLLIAMGSTATVACSALVSFNGLANGAEDGGAVLDAGDAATATDGSAQTQEASTDAGTDAAFFQDDFNRADSGTIGNGWLMKSPDAFALSAGTVIRLGNASEYPDNIVYRPAEKLGDLTIAAQVNILVASGPCAQLHARVQDTVTTSGQLDDYIFFLACSNTSAAILRQHGGGGSFAQLSQTSIAPMKAGDRMRLTFTVTGSDNVSLIGTVERANMDGTFTMVGTTSFVDTDPMRIRAPGSYGFSAASNDTVGVYSYDVFQRTSL